MLAHHKKVIDLKELGFGLSQIAQMTGMSKRNVSDILKKHFTNPKK